LDAQWAPDTSFNAPHLVHSLHVEISVDDALRYLFFVAVHPAYTGPLASASSHKAPARRYRSRNSGEIEKAIRSLDEQTAHHHSRLRKSVTLSLSCIFLRRSRPSCLPATGSRLNGSSGRLQSKSWPWNEREWKMRNETSSIYILCQIGGISASTSPTVSNVMRYFGTVLTSVELSKMARPLGIRQQALATAQVYVRRFYAKVEIRRTNPALVLATALYLACKMEECPQHIRMVLAEARHCWGKS
jgi:hypothetical protein